MAEHVYDYDWQSMYPLTHFLKGENEMDIKESLNKIYGKSAATNAPIKSAVMNSDLPTWAKLVILAR